MSDPTDAINRMDSVVTMLDNAGQRTQHGQDLALVMGLAKRVANLDIDAATEALADALHGVVILPGRFKLEAAAQATVEAALGVEDE